MSDNDNDIASGAPLPDTAHIPRAAILLADADPAMREEMRRILSQQYRVVDVADGQAALSALQTQGLDLVISAVLLPLLDAVRGAARARAMPVILLTMDIGDEVQLEEVAASADDYLVKPFRARELLARVGACLERARRQRETTDALRASEVAAREARRLLQISLDASHAGAWSFDVINNHFAGDATVARIFELPIAEVLAGRIARDTYINAIHPDDREMVEQALYKAITLDQSYEIDYRVQQANGSIVWVTVRGKLEHDEHGQPVRFPGLTFDITQRKQAEEALRTSEMRFRHMADHAPVMVWVTEPDGTCTYLSKSWYEFTGRTPVNSLGFGWLDPIHPDDREYVHVEFLHANKRRGYFRVEYRLQRYDGAYFWMIDQAVPHFSESGTFLGYIGSVIDITERKRTEARDHFLFQLLDTTRALIEPDQIIAASAQLLGTHLEADRCAYAEIDADEHGFTVLGDYITPGTISIVGTFALTLLGEEGLRLMQAGQPYAVANIIHNPHTLEHRAAYDNFQIGAFITMPLLKHGRFAAGMTVHQRVPRQWTADEIELVRLVTNLCWESIERARVTRDLRESEQRLQILYAQEQRARQQAEEASRLKDDFLATVSHELRTPLTAILGYSQVLQYRQPDAASTTRIVEKIVQSAAAQAQLIDDLLDVSQIVTGKLRLAPSIIDLLPVLQAAIDTVRPALDAKSLRLETELDRAASTVRGDASRLQQVVWNLLTNAIKFTPPGGMITMRLQITDGYARLTISDTGQGISADFLPYVFDRFRQADSTSTRAHAGLGLGLAIVRQLVEMHGGTVRAHSDGIGLGTAFTVYLPCTILADELRATPNPAVRWQYPPELAGLRVVVVDDQPDVLELLHEILAPCGIIVRMSRTARDALATLRTWRPDALLSDIAMPGDDGYWLIQQVRALAPADGGDMPAVALTAYVREEDRAHVLAAGFHTYLPKPIDAVALLRALATLVPRS